jgi:hypothetical protein
LYLYGKNFAIGENVTPLKTTGLVIIYDSATLILEPDEEVTLEPGFEVQLGGRFEVNKYE